jgi:hypothetical protein
MKDELFQELLKSVKQGAAIMKGTMQPSRSFELPETDVSSSAFLKISLLTL